MPISPGDLRGLLRADAVSLILGVLLMLTGLLAVALVSVLRRRAVPLLWLGAFSLLYGSRLLIRTGTFRLYVDLSSAVWDRVDAGMTYAVPIPTAIHAARRRPDHCRTIPAHDRHGWRLLRLPGKGTRTDSESS
jgi:hypothetical protein